MASICCLVFASFASAQVKPDLAVEIKEVSFEHKTKGGFLSDGILKGKPQLVNKDSRDINVEISRPGGILYSYTFNEISRRNASVNFTKDNYSMKFTGKTETNGGGESGNFEGSVRAIFIYPVIKWTPAEQQALEKFSLTRLPNANNVAFSAHNLAGSDLFELSKNYNLSKNCHIVEIDSKNKDPHAGIGGLDEGEYEILPEDKQYAMGVGAGLKCNYNGCGPLLERNKPQGVKHFDCDVPFVKLGSLLWVLYDVTDPKAVKQDQIGAAHNQSSYRFTISKGKKIDMYFKTVDSMNAYGDNNGTFKVIVVKK